MKQCLQGAVQHRDWGVSDPSCGGGDADRDGGWRHKVRVGSVSRARHSKRLMVGILITAVLKVLGRVVDPVLGFNCK